MKNIYLVKCVFWCALMVVIVKPEEMDFQANEITPNPPTAAPILSTTPLPIVLQMTTQQTVEPQSTENSSANKLPTEVSNSGQLDGESNQLNAEKHPDKEVNKNEPHKTPNDVEVFEQKPGPIKQNQEEVAEAAEPEPEAVPEAEPEAAEAEPEAAEAEPEAAEAEPELAAEPEAEPAPEPEPEENPEPEPEAAPESEPAAPEPDETPETEAEVKPEAEPEPEPKPETQPEEEMQNDAPAADETAPEATQATLVATDVLDNKENNTKTCYSCNSLEEITCKDKPTTQMNCKIGDADKNGGHRGCYTIFKADTNMTMRGCIDELAEEGLRDCLTKDKNCLLCYSNGCNNKPSPNAGFRVQLDISMLILLNGIAFGFIKYL